MLSLLKCRQDDGGWIATTYNSVFISSLSFFFIHLFYVCGYTVTPEEGIGSKSSLALKAREILKMVSVPSLPAHTDTRGSHSTS